MMIITTIFLPTMTTVRAADDAQASRGPINAEFAEGNHQTGLRTNAAQTAQITAENGSSRHLGLLPHPVNLTHLTGAQLDGINTPDNGDPSYGPASLTKEPVKTDYPTSYDLRQQGKVTDIRDQGSSGSCWAFASIASLESYLLPSETRDFSENNLKNTHDFDWGANDGGNNYMAAAYMTRWSGPVDEATDPYDPHSTLSPTFPPVKHVQNVLLLPPRGSATDNDNIKSALMTYGAVYSTYHTDQAYYNGNSYYYDGPPTANNISMANHAIAIVGWDDNYSRDNFATTPYVDGAFIVKNSWGSSWGDGGYFYISYADTLIGSDNAVFTAEPVDNYDHIYQYDWYGWTESWGFVGSDTGWFATNYTASGNQVLEAAGFYTAAIDSEYTIFVYRSGSPVETSTGTIHVPGYHTIQLQTGIPLTTGQPFRIEVRLRTPGYNFPIPIESRLWGYDSGATANESESFYSYNGVDWSDSYTQGISDDADVTLKAYTTSIPPLLGFSTSEIDGSLSVIDMSNDTVIATLDVGDGAHSAAISPGGAYVYVTDNSTGRLQVIDTRNLALIRSIPIGSHPHGVAVSPDGSIAAVANSGDSTVSLVDLHNGTVSHTITAGQGTEAVAFSPDGSTVYAANKADGTVTMIDVHDGSVSAMVTVGDMPEAIAIAPDGTAYVANHDSQNVSIINGDQVVGMINLTGHPGSIVVDKDSSFAYVSYPEGAGIDVIDLNAGTVTGNISTADYGPLGLSADGRMLYAAKAGTSEIASYLLPEGINAGTFLAGNNTTGIALGPVYQSPSLQFTQAEYSINRSDTTLTIAVERDGCIDMPLDTEIGVLGGNATAGVDYMIPASTVYFAPGARETTFDLSILNYTGRDKTLILSLIGSDEASIGQNSSTMVNIRSTPISYTTSLTAGWNLLSVPIVPENDSITSVIPPEVMADTKIIWVYDNNNPQSPWRFYKPTRTVNYISNLTYGTGFWIYVYNNTILTFTGTIPENQAIPIGKGWNLIGPSSITISTPAELYGGYYITWGYENGQWNFYKPSRTINTLSTVKPGYGYWVKCL
ncbi:MAG TPA: lectin like domain-containing protein [Methanocella sp.]|nr:lectin like domain-containing protein [Methanocella sp.]